MSSPTARTASCTAPSAHHLALFLTMVHLHLLADFHLLVYTQMLGWRHARSEGPCVTRARQASPPPHRRSPLRALPFLVLGGDQEQAGQHTTLKNPVQDRAPCRLVEGPNVDQEEQGDQHRPG